MRTRQGGKVKKVTHPCAMAQEEPEVFPTFDLAAIAVAHHHTHIHQKLHSLIGDFCRHPPTRPAPPSRGQFHQRLDMSLENCREMQSLLCLCLESARDKWKCGQVLYRSCHCATCSPSSFFWDGHTHFLQPFHT